MLILSASHLHAANWKSTGSDWFDPDSWNAGVVPASGDEINIGSSAASSGTAYISTGNASAGNSSGFSVGYNTGFTGGLVIRDTGTLTLASGAPVYIGRSGGTGAVWVSGSGVFYTLSSLSVGRSGAGASGLLEISGSGLVRDQNGYVGYQDTASGTVIISESGYWQNTGGVSIGGGGSGAGPTGTLLITDNGRLTNNKEGTHYGAYVGNSINSRGMATISGSGFWESAVRLFIGFSGTGTLVIEQSGSMKNSKDGGVEAASIAHSGAASRGSVIVRDNGVWLNNGAIYLGNAGQGVVTLEGDAYVQSAAAILGVASTGSGALILNGGIFETGTITKGSGGGTLTLNSGTIRANADSAGLISGVTVVNNGAGAAIDSGSYAVNLGIDLGGTGGLAKLGSGTLTLSAVQSYTGDTRLDDGVLKFTAASAQTLNNLSGSGAGAILETANALTLDSTVSGTYAGAFDVTGALTKSGAGTLTLSRADSLGAVTSLVIAQGGLALTGGTLTVTNATTLDSGGMLGLDVGVGIAKIDTGSFTFSSGAIIDLIGYSPVFTGTVDLVTSAANIAGSLSALALNRDGQALLVTADEYLRPVLQIDTTGKILQLTSDLVWNSNDTAHGTFNIAGGESFAVPVALVDRASASYTAFANWDGKSLIKSGAGTLVISTSAAYTGTTTVSSGTLQLATADAIARSAAVNLGADTTLAVSSGLQTLQNLSGNTTSVIRDAAQLTLNASANTSYAGVFAGVGALVKTGGAALTLSHAGDIGTLGSLAVTQGGLALTGGTLNVTGATTFAASTTLSLAGGVSKITTGAATFDAGSFINITSGAGTINLIEAGAAITTLPNLTLLNNGVANTVSLDIFNIYGLQLVDSDRTLQATTILIWNNTGEAHGTFNIGGGNTFTAPVALADRASASYTAFAGWDGKSLTKTGAGTLVLNTANTYTGTTTVSNGALQLDALNAIATSAAVTLSATGTLAVSSTQKLNNLSGSGAVELAAGSRAVVNSADATTYAGRITGQGALEKTGAQSLTLTGGNDYAGGTVITGGRLIAANAAALGTGAVVNNGALEFAITSGDAYAGSVSGAGAISVANNTGLTIAANSTLATTGAFTLGDNVNFGVIIGSGTGPIISAGGFVIGASSTLNIAGVTGGTELPFSIIDTTGGITNDFAIITIGGGGGSSADYLTVTAQKSADGNRYLLDATLTWNETGAGGHGNFTLTNAADTFDVGQVIADRAANSDTGWDGRSLRKLGAGTLIFSTPNTYTGTTDVADGALRLTAANAIAASSDVIVSSTAMLVAEASQQLNNLSGSGTVGILNDSLLTLNTTVTSTYAGRILGDGSLEKTGAATLTLTGSNTLTGGITITEGRLIADSIAALGGGAGAIVINTAFDLDVSATATLANALAGSGVFTKTGAAALTIAGDNAAYTGDINIDAGKITARHVAALGSGLVTTATSTSVEYTGIDGGTLQNALAGSGTFLVTSSTLSLAGASTIEKNVITASSVTLNHPLALGGDAAAVRATGTSSIAIDTEFARLGAVTLDYGILGFHRSSGDFVPKTATLASVSGSYGIFVFSVDLSRADGVTPGGVAGDHITITGSVAGRYGIAINAEGMPAVHGSSIELISTGAPTSDDAFVLTGTTGKITAGLTTYEFKQGDGSGQLPDTRSWYLADTGFSSVADAIFNTAGLMAADWHYSLDSLHLRMGDLRATGKPATTPIPKADRWMRFHSYQLNANSTLSGMPFDQYAFGVTFGADVNKRLAASNIVIGATVDFGNIHRNFDDDSAGETRNISGGVYVSWLHDAGWFIDGIAKYDHNNNTFDFRTDTSVLLNGSYNNNVEGLGLELGRRIEASDGWWFEGSVQAAVAWLEAAEYDIYPNQMKLHVAVDKATAFQYRGQLRFGRQWFATKLHPYVRLALVSNVTHNGAVHAATLSRRIDFDGLRAETGVGFAYHITPRSQMYADYEYAHAETYDRPWSINIGYRRAW